MEDAIRTAQQLGETFLEIGELANDGAGTGKLWVVTPDTRMAREAVADAVAAVSAAVNEQRAVAVAPAHGVANVAPVGGDRRRRAVVLGATDEEQEAIRTELQSDSGATSLMLLRRLHIPLDDLSLE